MNFDGICENFKSDADILDLNIGYSKGSQVLFIIIPTFAIFANLSVILTYHIKKCTTNRAQVSMEFMLYVLTIVETFISFYWLTNGIFLYSPKEMYDECGLCFAMSLVSIFLFIFDGIFLTLTIHNLRKIITDPIEGILRHYSRVKVYLIISFVGAFGATLLGEMARIYGRSPMLTCFVRTEFFDLSQNVNVLVFLMVPLSFGIYSLYLIMSMCFNRKMLRDRELSKTFYKYITYISVYIVCNIPTFALYALTLRNKIEPDTFLSWFSYAACLMSCSIPLVITLVRLLQGYVKIDFWRRRKVRTLQGHEKLLNEGGIRTVKTYTQEEFAWLEKKIMEDFMLDLFTSICHCLHLSKIDKTFGQVDEKTSKIDKKDCLDLKEITITKEDIQFDDKLVQDSAAFEVNFTEYAPKVFANFRAYEHLSEEDMISSLLPMKNKTSIRESQGKSGNFFISTEDNRYILKTINQDELYLIRSEMLEKLDLHLKRYPNSLICRIYGLFRMSFSNGDEVIVILMRNVIGDFKENILCQYDLKGSSVNRKTNFEFDSVNRIVMKDLNFDEIEKFLHMPKEEIERLRFSAMTDAYFFNDLFVMDYSLFVVKLSLSSKEIEKIYGCASYFEDESKERNSINIKVSEVKLGNIEPYKKYLYRSIHKNNVYIITIIDYLQTYNFFKYLETNIKYYIKSRPSKVEAISCVPPDIYCNRFIEYINKITDCEEIIK